MYRFIILLICSALLFSCKKDKNKNEMQRENIEAKKMLQGVWTDDATGTPIIKIKGDSIFYADPSISPVMFKVINDSLFTYGSVVNGYKIEKVNQYNFWFDSETGDVVQFSKSEDYNDLKFFSFDKPTLNSKKVIKKDSIINFNNVRYRGYVYINPSKIKVTQSRVSDEGINVDNLYYDNIIHICVYDGNKKLCSKDINKNMMSGIIPDDFLQNSILADMDFVGVNSKGYRYQAKVGIPDEASCYLVDVIIDKKSNVKFNVVK